MEITAGDRISELTGQLVNDENEEARSNNMSEENGSWFQKGYAGVKDEEKRLDSLYGPSRFWMPANEKERKTIVFVEDEPACIHEHNPKMNGSWKNWVTCIRDFHPDDPACCEILGGSYERYYTGLYTIVDCTKWTDKKGNSYQYELKLYAAKLKTLKLLQTKSQEDWGGSMSGKAIHVRRTSSDDAAVGNDFTLDREADMAKLWNHITYKGKKISEMFDRALKDEDERSKLTKIFTFQKGEGGALVPAVPVFNYFNILHPKKPSEMRAFLKSGKISDPDDKDSTSGGGNGAADEEVPF